MKKRSFLALSAIGCAALLASHATVHAQGYPMRPITLIVPFPAGTTTDNVARKLADFMRTKFGATVLVDNKVGADGNIAAQYVLRAAADGYTVFVTGNSVHGANANLYRELPFDPINDFDMIGGVMSIPMVLTVKPDFPANNGSEFVADAKKRQKPLFFATSGASTRGAAELFKSRFGLNMDNVPYRGSPQIIADLIAGQFDCAFIDANTVRPFLEDGRLKGLAITSPKRLSSLPNIPPVADMLPGFQFGAWVGVAMRKNTPPEINARLSTMVEEFANDRATGTYLASIGSTSMPMGPAQFKTFVESETKMWAEIVKSANIEKK